MHINSGFEGSIKSIINGIKKASLEYNIKSYIAFPNSKRYGIFLKKKIIIGNFVSRFLNRLIHKTTGNQDYVSILSTILFIFKIIYLRPDIIHLHNLHGNYLNHKIFFNYLIWSKLPIIITLHDCWYFTGGCAHFNIPSCNKWTSNCLNCPQLGTYPLYNKDRTSAELKLKEIKIAKLSKLIIVCPSKWIYNYAIKSKVFRNKKIKIIHNFFDKSIFAPKSTIRKKLVHKSISKVFLSVVANFSFYKGRDILLEICKLLKDYEHFIIVGADMPPNFFPKKNVTFIPKIEDQNFLSEIYASVDVLINPSRRESFGLVNIEALACGTPVVTCNTGIGNDLNDNNVGIVVDKIEALEFYKCAKKALKTISRDKCIKYSMKFEEGINSKKYISTYKELMQLSNSKTNYN